MFGIRKGTQHINMRLLKLFYGWLLKNNWTRIVTALIFVSNALNVE